MEPYLKLQNICLNYHNKAGETRALKDINIDVYENEFIAIVGPSGCGKTTILSIISGILSPSSGKITLNNHKLNQNTDKIGYMFQHDNLFEWRTIRQNVELGLEISRTKTPENQQKVNNLLLKYGLIEFADKHPHELSGGMRQRVSLIRTLVLNPKVLLLDEPFGALDYQTRQEVIDDVSNIIRKEKITSILVTHDITEAVCLSDKIVVLTKRPATVKNIIAVNLNKNQAPSLKRKDIKFNEIVNNVWKELCSEK